MTIPDKLISLPLIIKIIAPSFSFLISLYNSIDCITGGPNLILVGALVGALVMVLLYKPALRRTARQYANAAACMGWAQQRLPCVCIFLQWPVFAVACGDIAVPCLASFAMKIVIHSTDPTLLILHVRFSMACGDIAVPCLASFAMKVVSHSSDATLLLNPACMFLQWPGMTSAKPCQLS